MIAPPKLMQRELVILTRQTACNFKVPIV
uniref:Uncharacterized protein n=1 Tax=mine drainage metagenome TaxID=410659 RepID=E6QRX1_9ZZZZ